MIKFQEIILKLCNILTCLLKNTSMHIDLEQIQQKQLREVFFLSVWISLTLVSF